MRSNAAMVLAVAGTVQHGQQNTESFQPPSTPAVTSRRPFGDTGKNASA